jgi:hypothetical protein
MLALRAQPMSGQFPQPPFLRGFRIASYGTAGSDEPGCDVL